MRVQFGAGADRLTWVYAKLSPQLKKCAAYILEHPSEVATLSMRQVAANADVPWSTLTRLARAAGFGAYSELRDVYRASINNASAARPHRAGQLQTAVGESDIGYTLNIFQQVTLLNINTLFDDIDTDALDRAAREIADDSVAALRQRLALKSLLLPGGLGSTHKVMLFGKDVGQPALAGCSYRVRTTR